LVLGFGVEVHLGVHGHGYEGADQDGGKELAGYGFGG
jgi:hypothetical protein